MDLIKNYVKKNKRNLIILAVLLTLVTVFLVKTLHHNVGVEKESGIRIEKNENIVGGIFEVDRIEQTFTCKEDRLSAIGLRFATYSRECGGTVTFELFYDGEQNGNPIYKTEIEAKTLQDNAFRRFEFPQIKNANGVTFRIRVTASNTNNLPVTLWCTDADSITEGRLYRNGEELAGDLNLITYNCVGFGFNEVMILLVFAFVILALFFAYFQKCFVFGDSDAFFSKLKIPILSFSYLFLIGSVRSFVGEDGNIEYKLNFICIALLAVSLFLSIVFEKKLGILKFIRNKSLEVWQAIKTDAVGIRSGGSALKATCRLLLRLSYCFSLTFFALTLTVSLAFSLLSAKIIVLLFISSFLSLLFFILKSVLLDRNTRAATLFLAVCLLVGAAFSFCMPPTSDYTWDSQIHYERISDLKNMFFSTNDTLLDENLETIGRYNFTQFFEDPLAFLTKVTADRDVVNANYDATINLYQYLGYLPSAFALGISGHLNLSVIPMLFLTRFINVLLYALLIYFGMKRLLSGQYLFSAVALMPTAVYICTGFGYDSFVTAFIMFAYALFLSELQRKEEKISPRTVFLMLAALFVGCGPKMVYFALGIPFLFLGKEKFASKSEHKKYILAVLLTMLIIFLSFALPFFVNVEGSTDFRGAEGVDSAGQLKFILTNPFRYAEILITFILNFISFQSMNGGVTFYAYLGSPRSIYGTIAIIVIFFTAFADKNADVYPFKKKAVLSAVSILTCFLQIALVATALYISFTPVGYHTVDGCQYRYLFPIFIPFFAFLGSGRIKNRMSKASMNLAVFLPLLLVLFGTFYEVYITRALALL